MFYPEKPIHRHTFEGGMNSDLASKIMATNMARYFLNCRVSSTSGGNVGVVTNVKGNILMYTPLPDGVNQVIGHAEDQERNKFYFAVYNSTGYHTWYMYDNIANSVSVVLQCITDTNGIDIFKWDPDFLILHAEVIQGDKLYWVNGGLGKACKFNIKKALDKSDSGYGLVIFEDYINAYKRAPVFAPKVRYTTDAARNSNFLYGQLQKFASRYHYDDGDISHVSEWSAVPTPPNESYLGERNITYNNNCIEVNLNTGSPIVTKIELLVKIGSGSWLSVDVLEKEKLKLSDDTTYTYRFYNDGSYTAIDQEKVIKPYSYLPTNPKCQSFVKNAMVYTNFKEGFPVYRVLGAAVYTDEELYLPPGTENELNEPSILFSEIDVDKDRASNISLHVNRYNVTTRFTIGFDVKKGNLYQIYGRNGEGDNYHFQFLATEADDAVSISNMLKQALRVIGRGMPRGDNGISNESTDVSGNVSFNYKYLGKWRENKIVWSGSVNPVTFESLKDNGLSINKIKSGSDRKYGIVIEDSDGKKSLTYTTDGLLVKTPFITEVGGIKRAIHTISLKSRPPVWARYWHLVRTNDYTQFIQMLIQRVIDVDNEDDDDNPGSFIDLAIGSLFTYQKKHPNTVLQYTFEKGDRLRLIKDTTTDTLYPYFETEVLSYSTNTIDDVNSNITSDGSSIVLTVDVPQQQNVGRNILISGVERTIIGVASNGYILDSPNGQGSTAEPITFSSYQLIDRRGIVRIKKPAGITIADFSTIELFKPQRSIDDQYKKFYDFGYKFEISDWGTAQRAFRGNVQDQDGTSDATVLSTPAIIKVIEGDSYVRNRELPTNNAFPGTQVTIEAVEDAGFSDFYESDLHSIGRVYPQDDGSGEKSFGSRARYSNNYIEDTKINGLNDFDNTDREDYNDPYGDIMLTRFRENRLFCFKELRTAWVPVLQSIFQDNSGQQVVGLSSKLLNQMQYLSWEGGIGSNPESWFSNGTYQYFASTNSGVFIRVSGDGCDPISSMYGYDKDSREILSNAHRNNLKISGGFDRENNEAIWSVPAYREKLFDGSFIDAEWLLYSSQLPGGTVYAVTTPPVHGDVTIDGDGYFNYVPDTDYIGADSFMFNATLPGGSVLGPVKKCITVVEEPVTQPIWQIDEDSNYCEQYTETPFGNDGYMGWKLLEAVNPSTNTLTGLIKPNLLNVSPQAIVQSTADYTFNQTTSPSPSGGANDDIWYNKPTDKLYKKIGGIWKLLTDRLINTDYVGAVFNDISCPVDDPPIPVPEKHFSVTGNFGMTITSTTDVTTTGVPTASAIPGQTTKKAYTTITAGEMSVSLTGTPTNSHLRLVLKVGGTILSTPHVIGAGDYSLNFGANVTTPTEVEIYFDLLNP